MDPVLLFVRVHDDLARLPQVLQLVGQQAEPRRQRIRVPREIDPSVVHIGLEKPRPNCALGAELLHASQRQVVDQSRLGAVGDDGQVVARDDDPVSGLITGQGHVAGRRQEDRDSIELLVFEQLLDIKRNGFLDHRGRWTLLRDQTKGDGLCGRWQALFPASHGRDCSERDGRPRSIRVPITLNGGSRGPDAIFWPPRRPLLSTCSSRETRLVTSSSKGLFWIDCTDSTVMRTSHEAASLASRLRSPCS